MAKGTARIPPSMLDELIQENKRWFELYENHPRAPQSKSYRNKAKKFLQYKEHNQKPFHLFKQADVDSFIDMLKSAGYDSSGISPFICAISGCAKILREEYPNDFSPSFLSGISNAIPKSVSEPSGEVLTLGQISLIKKYTFEQGDLQEKYIFEKLFRRGIQVEELKATGRDDFGENVDFAYKANQYFKKLTRYLAEQGEYIRATNLNSDHFKKSHQAYFFLCPICQERIENLAENWILARTELDEEYRLVHAACRGKLR